MMLHPCTGTCQDKLLFAIFMTAINNCLPSATKKQSKTPTIVSRKLNEINVNNAEATTTTAKKKKTAEMIYHATFPV